MEEKEKIDPNAELQLLVPQCQIPAATWKSILQAKRQEVVHSKIIPSIPHTIYNAFSTFFLGRPCP